MKQLLIVFFTLYMAVPAAASDGKYAVDEISPDLKQGANAIIRDHETIFTIASIGKATKTVRHTITILNERAKSMAFFAVRYDKRTKIDHMEAYIYDASGKEIKKIRKSDIKDISAVPGGSFYGDSRIKYVDLSMNQYPYTISYEYEVTTDGLLFYPIWDPVDDQHIAVENAEYKIITSNNVLPRYKEQNITPVVIREEDGKKVYHWRITGMPEIDREPYGPVLDELVPRVYTAPNDFSMGGYAGNMETWDGLGRWQNQLLEGRNNLPETTAQKIQAMVADAPDKRSKVKIIYDYLQSKTRYVSIQLGIGGWQPFPSSYVDENGYGDCKALTFYTKSLLETIGIDAYYTLVMAGKNASNIRKDFPSRQFNHVILSVPMASDTIWLECTSQTNPFGYVGSFTGDRDVLMVTDNGAEVVHTPVYGQKDNRLKRTADVFVEEDGDATARVRTHYKGLKYESDNMNFYIHDSPSEQMKWLYGRIDIPSFKIDSFSFDLQDKPLPEVTENLSLNLPRYASVSGKRIFIRLNLMNRQETAPYYSRDRKTDVIIETGWVDSDTIRYHIPEGYKPEYLPEPIHFKSRFGEYSAKVIASDDVITYVRTLRMNKGRSPAETYNEMVKFLENVRDADRNKMVLVSRET